MMALLAVITLTDSMALAQAKRAYREIQPGNYKGNSSLIVFPMRQGF